MPLSVAEVSVWYKIILNVIGDGGIKRRGFGRVSGITNACEIGQRVVLISVAKVFGHLDELDISRAAERLEDRVR